MTDLKTFLKMENIPHDTIWYYIKDGKKMPIGKKNNISIEDIPTQEYKNKPKSIFVKSKDVSSSYSG